MEQIIDDCKKTLAFFDDSEIASNVIFVRYEDISRFPTELASQIYKRVGAEMSEAFLEKFNEATHSAKG